MQFLLNCLQPQAVLMLFVFLVSLLGYGYPGYQARNDQSVLWLLWVFVGILAIVAWVRLVFF